LLGVGLQHRLRARKGRVVERGTVDGTENGLLFLRQRARRAGQERRGKKFNVGQVVRLDYLAAQTGAAVVMAQPVWLVSFSNSRSRAMALICISIPFCQISVQLLPLAMRSR